jgi:hypothetical protein
MVAKKDWLQLIEATFHNWILYRQRTIIEITKDVFYKLTSLFIGESLKNFLMINN